MNRTTQFSVGDRIECDSMTDDPDPIPRGTRGTVTRASVHDLGDGEREHFTVRWDTGRTLHLVVPPDSAHRIPSLTTAQEQALMRLCERYGVAYEEADYLPAFDLPGGYVAGWVGGKLGHQGPNGPTIYVGVSLDGEVSS